MATAKVESGFTDDWQGERTLAECNLHMLKSADTCDVTFRVGESEDIVLAHRFILISRSCVFYSMLCGDWSKEETIKIPDVSMDFFWEFLTFLYTDDCSLTADNVTGLLYLSKKYAVHRLHRLCLSFLQTNLTPENACVVLEQAHFFDEDQLFQQAMKIVIKNSNVSLLTPGFCDLGRVCLDKILISKDLDLYTKSEVIFDGVLSWASAECSRQGKEVTPRNQRDVLGETVYLVGFTGFDAAVFVRKVVPSQLLDDTECLKILSNINCPGTDVGLFRTVDIKSRPIGEVVLHELEVYKNSSFPSKIDHLNFMTKFVHDALNIKCDLLATLHGITLTPSDAEYEITITQADNTLLTAQYTTSLTETKLDFLSSVRMEPGLTYCLDVKCMNAKLPPTLLRNLKEKVCSPNKWFHLSQDSKSTYNNQGFIKKLSVS